MEWVETTGRTVAEAIDSALDELGVHEEDVEHEVNEYFEKDKPWGAERRKDIDQRLRARLSDLSARLGDAEWLDGDFSAGDLMMVEVLLRLEGQQIEEFPNLVAYCDRARARPAFNRAFAAQRKVFEDASKGA